MNKFSKLLKVLEGYTDPFDLEGGGTGVPEPEKEPVKEPYTVATADLIKWLNVVEGGESISFRTWQDRARPSTFRMFEWVIEPTSTNGGKCQLHGESKVNRDFEYDCSAFIVHLERELSQGMYEIRFQDTAGDLLKFETVDKESGIIWLDYVHVIL